MKSKGILFCTEMVQAIQDNRKTMTRRVVSKKQLDRAYKHPETSVAPYQVGDILWVRETWCNINKAGIEPEYYYKADAVDAEDYDSTEWKWRPSIFMPRAAARIWLKVTDVRCERLWEITPHDAWLEGCRIGNSFAWEDHIPELQQMCRDVLFRDLWDSINMKRCYGWLLNPWVWVILFERCEKPVEET